MESYTVQVDLGVARPTLKRPGVPEPTLDQLDVLMECVDAFDGSWGTSRNRLQVVLSMPGESLRQAVYTALLVVEDAVKQAKLAKVTILGVEADLHGLRPESSVIPRLLSTGEVAQLLGISRQAVFQQADKLGGVLVGKATYVFNAARIEDLANQKAGEDA